MRGKKIDVSAELVTQWVEETLFEWFPGYTDGAGGHQYKIVHMGENRFRVQAAAFDGDPGQPRTFIVTVNVREEAP